jgi:hypothetical protein
LEDSTIFGTGQGTLPLHTTQFILVHSIEVTYSDGKKGYDTFIPFPINVTTNKESLVCFSIRGNSPKILKLSYDNFNQVHVLGEGLRNQLSVFRSIRRSRNKALLHVKDSDEITAVLAKYALEYIHV